ncbi:MAG: hypothetical protein QNJ98_07515 [Planctomycetota bacterium]|nr:hypothetical protein [Planctomycetota bacterium]
MTQRTWTTILIVMALLWATRFVVDPRPSTGPTDPVAEKEKGDRAFEAEQWWLAGRQYRRAFALEDARAEDRLPHRAFLAQQAGVVYARVATDEASATSEAERRDAQSLAGLWLEEALALDASRGWLHYELALVYDRLPEALREPVLARDAYAAFVAWVDDPQSAGQKPEADAPPVALARKRLQELTE